MSTAEFLVKFNSLPAELRKELMAYLDQLLKRKHEEKPGRKNIPFGKFKGKINIADDLDEPTRHWL